MGYVFTRTNNGVKVAHTNGSSRLLKSVSLIETNGATGLTIYGTGGLGAITIDGISSIDSINGVVPAATLSGVVDQLDILFNGSRGNGIKRTYDEFSRPADIVAYSAKDVISDGFVRSFALGDVSGQSGIIRKAILTSNDKTLVGNFRLHFYNSSPNLVADNAPNAFIYATRWGYLGFIDFPAMSSAPSTTTDASVSVLSGLQFSYALSDNRLFYVLETLSVFTPVASSAFRIDIESSIPV